jgi:hypothetical protein
MNHAASISVLSCWIDYVAEVGVKEFFGKYLMKTWVEFDGGLFILHADLDGSIETGALMRCYDSYIGWFSRNVPKELQEFIRFYYGVIQ